MSEIKSINRILVETLEGATGLPVAEEFHGDGAEEYIAYQIQDDRGVVFGDGEPLHEVYIVTVHLFVKRSTNYLRLKKAIRQALLDADFTWPRVLVLDDGDSRHLIFEAEASNDYDL